MDKYPYVQWFRVLSRADVIPSSLSLCSEEAGVGRIVVLFPARAIYVSTPKIPCWHCNPHSLLFNWLPGDVSSGVKRSGREADKSSLLVSWFRTPRDISSPIPAAEMSKARVCGCSLPRIAGSHRIGVMDICPLWVLCVIRLTSLRRADHRSRGLFYRLWYVKACDLETSRMRWPWPSLGCWAGEGRGGEKEEEEKSYIFSHPYAYIVCVNLPWFSGVAEKLLAS